MNIESSVRKKSHVPVSISTDAAREPTPAPPPQDHGPTIAELELLKQCAAYVELVYHELEQVRQLLEEEGYEHVTPIEVGSFQAIACARGDHAYLIVRGTDDFRDWLHNGFAIPWLAPRHLGIQIAWRTLRKTVLGWFESLPDHQKRLTITGHSLGGGISLIAAHDLTTNHSVPVEAVVTFGAPQVIANWRRGHYDKTSTGLDSTLGKRVWRVVHETDVVTILPLDWIGLTHVGQVVYIDEHDQLFAGECVHELRQTSQESRTQQRSSSNNWTQRGDLAHPNVVQPQAWESFLGAGGKPSPLATPQTSVSVDSELPTKGQLLEQERPTASFLGKNTDPLTYFAVRQPLSIKSDSTPGPAKESAVKKWLRENESFWKPLAQQWSNYFAGPVIFIVWSLLNSLKLLMAAVVPSQEFLSNSVDMHGSQHYRRALWRGPAGWRRTLVKTLTRRDRILARIKLGCILLGVLGFLAALSGGLYWLYLQGGWEALTAGVAGGAAVVYLIATTLFGKYVDFEFNPIKYPFLD